MNEDELFSILDAKRVLLSNAIKDFEVAVKHNIHNDKLRLLTTINITLQELTNIMGFWHDLYNVYQREKTLGQSRSIEY